MCSLSGQVKLRFGRSGRSAPKYSRNTVRNVLTDVNESGSVSSDAGQVHGDQVAEADAQVVGRVLDAVDAAAHRAVLRRPR